MLYGSTTREIQMESCQRKGSVFLVGSIFVKDIFAKEGEMEEERNFALSDVRYRREESALTAHSQTRFADTFCLLNTR